MENDISKKWELWDSGEQGVQSRENITSLSSPIPPAWKLCLLHVIGSSAYILTHWPCELGQSNNRFKCHVQFAPEKFVETLKLMEHRYGAKDFVTSKDTGVLAPGTYYLTEVDSMYRRFYAKKSEDITKNPTNASTVRMVRSFMRPDAC